ncbi:hypothetical protein [Fodinicola feengrottensis]|uniref:Condensation domain-containing protein n=1 Tax=Fodinicola feengrottensis TaxID=435914 RepID=A0ABN2IKJ1_9ACTN|nr:hypothetical protein [Fodinicola feengrottensis]
MIVTFTGMRATAAPLSWGQSIVYDALLRRTADEDYNYNLTRVVPVPAGCTSDDVATAVAALVRRHDSLHTIFPGRTQEVIAAGELEIRVGHADTASAVEKLAAEPFDPAHDWGIRATLVCFNGQPREIVLGLSHLAVDAWAAGMLTAELRRLLRRPDVRLPAAWQPADQARHEQSEAGIRRSERGLEYLRSVAGGAAPTGPLENVPSLRHGELRSQVAEVAAARLAERCRTSDSTVYLAAFAHQQAKIADTDTCFLKTVAYNRTTDNERGCVAPFALDAFVSVSVAGPDGFAGLVKRSWAASMRAYQHAQCDPAAARELVETAGVNPPVMFNDARSPVRPSPPRQPTGTTFRWLPDFRPPGLRCYLAIADDRDGQTLSLLADHRADVVRDFLYRMEELLMRAA